jgi:hypothetical protein
MFLRKLTVLLVPLGMLLLLCLLLPLFSSLGPFFASLVLGLFLGILLALLLPLSGATRLREPFAWLLVFPAALILLILLYQYLAMNGVGYDWPLLRLLAVNDARVITVEAAFAAYMLTFSIRTGKGI